ncbi:mechanosensitive ion channel family protein [Aliidiomarina maris]|uniref:Small-conductance mechanosensitive channel n=1 Tax=Aliidiomarina maris TaxID=531312 RepID=A0A327X346_9GAMM|nr:mechanosensitive ion channel family protein [Aliidiomarina maris]MCL5049359.1 mechanosensitive ion channel family protein [Bacillota bacterium]RAK00642.1 small-conductance mechanosensitive channel [Aliidiomarina maris]RUO27348.1 mechanosensitive ion channel protein [Aliidiomarina maris]
MELFQQIMQPLQGADGGAWLRALGYLVLGLVLRNIIVSGMRKYVDNHTSPHKAILFRRAISYLVLFVFVLIALSELGFHSGVLLAVAGVLSVAIGFASQASTSNFISGLFLLGEKSFKVGDIVAVQGTRGEVISIDWLAIKIRTFDNLYVRVPNDDLIKGHVTNFSKFSIRRLDVQMWLALETDCAALEKLLNQTIVHEQAFLHQPAPELFRLHVGVLGIQVQYSVWAQQEGFFTSRSKLIDLIVPAMQNAGVVITQTPSVVQGQDNSFRMPYP